MRTLTIITITAAVLGAGCGDKRHSEGERRGDGNRVAAAGPEESNRTVVYPYSVVPGGVASKSDIEEAMVRDAPVADHYREVNVATLVPVTLRSDTQAYVSFRKNGRIYWTSRKVHLLQGEQVLSNGTDCIRGRCGNRISWKPRQPVLPKRFEEPTSAELNTAQIRGEQVPQSILGPLLPNSPVPNPVASIGATAAVAGGGPAVGSTGGVGGGAPSAGGGGDTGTGVVTSQPNGGVPVVLPPSSGGSAAPPIAVPSAGPNLPGSVPPTPISVSVGGASTVSWVPGAASSDFPKGLPGTPISPPVYVVPLAQVTPPVPGVPGMPDTPSTPQLPSTPGTPGTPPGVDSPVPPGSPVVEVKVPNADVPEPATMLLVGCGLVIASLVRRGRTGRTL